MNWSKVKLRDVVKIKGGGTPRRENPEFYNGNIPWATIKDLSDKIYLSDTQEHINEEAIKLSASNLIPAGNIILATRMGLGKVVINTVDVAINQDLKALFCAKVIYPKYLLYYLKSISNSIEKQGVGVTVKGITVKQVENWDIPLPPLSEQKRIVEILDRADELRKQRAEADALSERILPALFIKMFGDPSTNPMGWDVVPFKKLGNIVTGNTPSRKIPEYYGDVMEWIKSDNINTPYHILTPAEEYLSLEGVKVGRIAPPGSTLVTCIAGSMSCIGNAAFADREVAFNGSLGIVV